MNVEKVRQRHASSSCFWAQKPTQPLGDSATSSSVVFPATFVGAVCMISKHVNQDIVLRLQLSIT